MLSAPNGETPGTLVLSIGLMLGEKLAELALLTSVGPVALPSSLTMATEVRSTYWNVVMPKISRAQTATPKAPANIGFVSSIRTSFFAHGASADKRSSRLDRLCVSKRAITCLEKLLK